MRTFKVFRSVHDGGGWAAESELIEAESQADAYTVAYHRYGTHDLQVEEAVPKSPQPDTFHYRD